MIFLFINSLYNTLPIYFLQSFLAVAISIINLVYLLYVNLLNTTPSILGREDNFSTAN